MGARVQLESVPRLPAGIIAKAPQGTAVLHVTWRHEVYGDEIQEAVTVHVEANTAVIKRSDGEATRVALELRPLPRRGGRALLLRCPSCHRPSRYLYAWKRVGHRSAIRADWPCRTCAGLVTLQGLVLPAQAPVPLLRT